jgi:cysteine desulfurase family protein (TIGR01976 family)
VATPDIASVETIRSDFPALERTVAGRPVAYLDGPGGTQVPRVVGETMTDYLYHHNANTHWAYDTSEETDAALARARDVFAAYLNGAPEGVAFGHNMTTLTYHLSRALGRRLHAGDEIVVTELDHHANIDPWVALELERGVMVRWVRMIPETGQLDWEQFVASVGARTKLVAVGAASNALGTVNDVVHAGEVAHRVGALLFVDGVHSVQHVVPDVTSLGCEFFACSPYKCYGPHLGVLWGRPDLLAELDFPRLVPASDEPPERAETGTLNHEGIVGAAAAVDWLASLAPGGDRRARLETTYRALHERSARLFRRLWDGLAALDGVTLYGPPPEVPRTPTAAFTVADRPSRQVTRMLADRGVFTSHGDFYAHTVVERLGLQPDGLVRAGLACYTTEEDIERLLAGVRDLIG